MEEKRGWRRSSTSCLENRHTSTKPGVTTTVCSRFTYTSKTVNESGKRRVERREEGEGEDKGERRRGV